MRQLLIESMILGLAGGAIGLLFAFWGLGWMQALGAQSVPRVHDIRINGGVLLFTLARFARLRDRLRPRPGNARRESRSPDRAQGRARHVGRSGLPADAASGRGRSSSSPSSRLAVMLLVGAGLLIRSFAQLQRVPTGFSADRVLTLGITLSGRKYPDTAKVQAAYRELWARLARVPGVDAAGGVSSLPLSNMMAWGPITVEGRTAPAERAVHQRRSARRGGRLLPRHGNPAAARPALHRSGPRDRPRVVIVDERMAREIWLDEDPVGKRIRTGGIDANSNAPWITVVGVVGNVKQDALDAESRMALYMAQTQLTPRAINVVVRSHGDPAALAPAVRPGDPRSGSGSARLRRADDGGARERVAGAAQVLRCCC